MEELTVAILIEDLKMARDISAIFRKVGIVPSIFTDLKEFWERALNSLPSLCLVHVELMSDGQVSLAHHPCVKSAELPVAFLYDAQSSPLLHSTFEVFNLGLINLDFRLSGQIKSLLKRFNYLSKTEMKATNLKILNKKLDHQLNALNKELQDKNKKEFFINQLNNMINSLTELKLESNFYANLASVLDSNSDISTYSFYIPSAGGHKLISPQVSGKKMKTLPSLWLESPNENEIDNIAMELSLQTACDILGGELIQLNIKDKNNNVVLLMYIKTVTEEYFQLFPWIELETYLSAYLSYFENDSKSNRNKMQISFFDFIHLLDDNFYTQEFNANEDLFIVIDFKVLIESTDQLVQSRFFWGQFYREIMLRIEKVLTMKCNISNYGNRFITILVEEENSESCFEVLKKVTQSFPYWKYFEDSDLVLGKELNPIVRFIPTSYEAFKLYLKSNGETYLRANYPSKEGFQVPTPNDKLIQRERSPLL